MPKVRRHDLPPAVLRHLLDRIASRNISADQLGTLAEWLDREPEVPPVARLNAFQISLYAAKVSW
jgi:hypothetical protein